MAAWRDCWGFLSWKCPYFLCDGSWRNSLPLFCRMFSFYSIECFPFLLSVVSLFFPLDISLFLSQEAVCAFFLPPTFDPVRTSWCEHHIGLPAACLFLTSDLHFLHAQSVILLLRSGLICCVRKVKRMNPVSFTPNPVNHNYLLHPCEGWRRKTKNSWRARMRVGLGQRFFMGKYIVSVRRVIYSTNWRSASITATRTLFLRGAMHC